MVPNTTGCAPALVQQAGLALPRIPPQLEALDLTVERFTDRLGSTELTVALATPP